MLPRWCIGVDRRGICLGEDLSGSISLLRAVVHECHRLLDLFPNPSAFFSQRKRRSRRRGSSSSSSSSEDTVASASSSRNIAIDRMNTCTHETADSGSDTYSNPSSCHHHHRHRHRHSYVVFLFPPTFVSLFFWHTLTQFVKTEVVIRPLPSMPYLVLHYSYLVTLSPKTPPSQFPASPLPLISIGAPHSTCSMLAITSRPTPTAPLSLAPITPTTGACRSPGAAHSSPSPTTSQNQRRAAVHTHLHRPPRRYPRHFSASHSARPSPQSPPCTHRASRTQPMLMNSSYSQQTSSRVVSFTCHIPPRARVSYLRLRRRYSLLQSVWTEQRSAVGGLRGRTQCSTRCIWRRTSMRGGRASSWRVDAARSLWVVHARTSSRTH
jgi:hypothetical protein